MGQPIHWRNKLNRISSQDPKRRGKVVFALLIDPAKRNNSIHCLQSVDWPIFQLLFFLIHYNPVCSEIILNILELIASLILNTAMLSVQQAKKIIQLLLYFKSCDNSSTSISLCLSDCRHHLCRREYQSIETVV